MWRKNNKWEAKSKVPWQTSVQYRNSNYLIVAMDKTQREVLGNEPIGMTLPTPSATCFLVIWDLPGITIENKPERSPEVGSAIPLGELKLLSALRMASELLSVSCVLKRTPQGQLASFLKQFWWKTNSQDLHFSTSPSCWFHLILPIRNDVNYYLSSSNFHRAIKPNRLYKLINSY